MFGRGRKCPMVILISLNEVEVYWRRTLKRQGRLSAGSIKGSQESADYVARQRTL